MGTMENRVEKRLEFVGTGKGLFWLYALYILFSILTLGIYSFWGKTRLRQYLWGKTLLFREPLEYTGTGWELFRSFLLVSVLVMVATLGVIFSTTMINNPGFQMGVLLLFTVSVYLVWPWAFFSALRFRMTRTTWRGIYGNLEGSGFHYALAVWGRLLLVLLTLGLYAPYYTAFVTRYIVERASFGNERFHFVGDVRVLRNTYLLCWVVGLLGGVGLSMMGAALEVPLLTLAGIPLLWGAMFVYHVSKLRWRIDGIRFGDLRLESSIPLGGYFWLMVRFGLLLLPFGLGYPWAQAMRLRYLANHVAIHGDPDWARLGQNTKPVPGSGEGLLSVLEMDMGF